MNDEEAKIILEDIKNTYKYCYKNNNAKQINIDVDYKTAEAIETILNMIYEYEVACSCGKQEIETLNYTIRKLQKDIKKQKQQISNLETAGQALEKVYKAEIEKQKERIKYLERSISRKEHSLVEEEQDNVELETKLQEKDKIINNSIIEIEKLRQYFSEDLQVEFIKILEILKDKKVIDW